MTTVDAPLLSLRSISKSFGGVTVLSDVNLDIVGGEVHGLLGENGSGKSTLIKVLSGFYLPDAGTLSLRGQGVALPATPSRLRGLGLSFVFQDLALVPALTVLENFRISANALANNAVSPIRWKRERAYVEQSLGSYGVDLDLDSPVGELNGLQRAMLAIVRALADLNSSAGADRDRQQLLVLDEPTVFLPKAEVNQLFQVVRRVTRDGSSVLLVTHDLDEIVSLTDRVTVLRDGRLVRTAPTAELSHNELVSLIIGRDLAEQQTKTTPELTGTVALSARGLTGSVVRTIDLSARKGEVLGMTGLAGSGFDEVPYLLFGGKPTVAGTLQVGTERSVEAKKWTPTKALAHGIALVPEDRQNQGSVANLSVAENLMLPVLKRYFHKRVLRNKKVSADAHRLTVDYEVKPPDPTLGYGALSGGNQQKVLLAKWLQIKPSVLLLVEPTQGVDVGTRASIFRVIREASAAGCAVICSSSDYDQLATICDRVLIMQNGRIHDELADAAVTKERIAAAAYTSVDTTAEEEPGGSN